MISSKFRAISILLLSSLPLMALGNNVPVPPKEPSAVATAGAGAEAASASTSKAGAASDATAAVDVDVDVQGSPSSSSSTSSTGPSSATLSNSYRQVRQTPMAYAPTVFPSIGCGRAVTVGGSTPIGAAAVGFNWSNKECEVFAAHVSLAQAFSAIGRNELSCQTLLHLELAKEIFATLPTCTPSPVVAPPAPAAAVVEEAQPIVINITNPPAACEAKVTPAPAVAKSNAPRKPPVVVASSSGSCALPETASTKK